MEWHVIHDPADPELDRLAERYKLHPLHVEDCRHRNQSAKVEEQDGYMFIVLKSVAMDKDFSLEIDDVDFFVGKDFLITVEEGPCPALKDAFQRTKADGEKARPDRALYRVMDAIVDSYLPLLDRINDELDTLEDTAVDEPTPQILQRIFALKRTLVQMRRVLSNMRDVANYLQRITSGLIRKDMWPFLRDIYDHVARALDQVEMQRDLLTGAMDIYLSSVANRTNQVMKVLTVLGTLATPAIVISGIYGMNLKHLPFAEHPHAPGIVTAIILSVSTLLLLVLRFFRWF